LMTSCISTDQELGLGLGARGADGGRDDSLLFVITGSISCKLQNFSTQVFQFFFTAVNILLTRSH